MFRRATPQPSPPSPVVKVGGSSEPGFIVRWKGRQQGPYTRAHLERKLAIGELGMLHEVLIDGVWIRLREFLSEKAPAGSTSPGMSLAQGKATQRTTSTAAVMVRWRGRQTGPFTPQQLESKLENGEISRLHETLLDGVWTPVSAFLAELAWQRQLDEVARQAQQQRRQPDAQHRQKGRIRTELHGLGKSVVDRESGKTLTLLDNLSLVLEANEFIALLGPSGSGKSTLMDAINGRRPATSGAVLVNGEDLYSSYRKYRQSFGYVPQKDIVHATLTVRQALTFTARLRLPATTPEEQLQRIVAEVIHKMGLEERENTLIQNLSGGQLKRVSLGAELIAEPSLLFLDEATSGLDAGTEAKMMALFRRVADEGRCVVCITHNIENVGLCDQVVVLVRGQLAYFGPPDELPAFFGISKIGELYDRLEEESPQLWAENFQSSGHHRRFVADRLAPRSPEIAANQPLFHAPAETRGEWFRQFRVLVARYAVMLVQDRKNLSLLLLQAPFIALLAALVFGKESEAKTLQIAFIMSVSAIWFGCINASREIVKELPIYLRERAVNMRIFPYLASKAMILGGLCATQCLALHAIVASVTGLGGNPLQQLGVLFLTSLSSMMLGLLISACVDTSDKAISLVPVLLIPQVMLAGVVTPLDEIGRALAKVSILAFWSMDALKNTFPSDSVLRITPAIHGFSIDLVAIGIMAAVFGLAAIIALKRKDAL